MTEVRPKRDDFCCNPCEDFKELTKAAHDSLVCRIDKMEEQLRNVKIDVGARDVKTTYENTKRENGRPYHAHAEGAEGNEGISNYGIRQHET